jgi:Bacterial Ig domain/L,D-transpeptidase catalytic domain
MTQTQASPALSPLHRASRSPTDGALPLRLRSTLPALPARYHAPVRAGPRRTDVRPAAAAPGFAPRPERHNPRVSRSGKVWRLALVVALSLTACQESARPAKAVHQAALVIPRADATGQPATTEIGLAAPGYRVRDVTLTDPAGTRVAGTVRDDTSWVPDKPLRYGTRYQATVSAAGPNGARLVQTTGFTTMSDPGGQPIRTRLALQAGGAYGVAMPLVVEFSSPVPAAARADVLRRLSVRSEPPQEGAWRWYGDRQVVYRPRSYWQPGTSLTVSTTLGGLPVAGRYVDTDRGAGVTIGAEQLFRISNATKQMQVLRDGQVIKTFPVSLGKPITPSSSGAMVITTKEPSAHWVYSDHDQLDVQYAERLTADGEYIHAAPWSVADQGHNNVTHGCTNLAPDNAKWVFDNARVGDPVTVTGTEKHLAPDNGWTMWDVSWADFLKR